MGARHYFTHITRTGDRIRGQDREQRIDHQPVAELRVSNVIGQRKEHQRQEKQNRQADAVFFEQSPHTGHAQRCRQYSMDGEER